MVASQDGCFLGWLIYCFKQVKIGDNFADFEQAKIACCFTDFKQVEISDHFTDFEYAKIDGCFAEFELVVILLTLNKPRLMSSII